MARFYRNSFYENQQEARRKTGLLAFYFALAVILIVLAVDIVLFVADRYLVVSSDVVGPTHTFSLAAFAGLPDWLASPRGLIASAITALILVLGSAIKTLQLGKGGDKVAIMAGGTWVDLNTQHPQERQLLNVVEEMAIASGIKPPRVYLLRQEAGINAFVAGLTPNESALAVTQGALDQLTRDELQGVIGHEFSHILNSDMRINVRMIGMLAGILMIGQIGRVLMETRSRTVSTSNKKGSNPLPLIGAALWLIGSIGLFFGQLIQAALSRQREFLADASSVQFTRNPLGIGGALLKIRDASQHSYLLSRHAANISHMCFGEVMTHRFNALFATHPPLDERIRAIDPSLEKHLQRAKATPSTPPTTQASAGTGHGASGFAPVTSAGLKASVGQLTTPNIQLGQRIHHNIPDDLLAAAHTADQAPLLLYALVLAAPQQDAAVNQALKAQFAPVLLAKLVAYRKLIMAMPLSLRLPLFDLSMPTLQHLPAPAKTDILSQLHAVIGADKCYTLSECAYYLLTEKYLTPPTKSRALINSIHKVEAQVVVVFTALAHASRSSEALKRSHFERAMRCLGVAVPTAEFAALPDAGTLSNAMRKLSALSPLLKQSLVENAVDMVVADQQIHLSEIELLRAFSEMLDCPMPPVDETLLTH